MKATPPSAAAAAPLTPATLQTPQQPPQAPSPSQDDAFSLKDPLASSKSTTTSAAPTPTPTVKFSSPVAEAAELLAPATLYAVQEQPLAPSPTMDDLIQAKHSHSSSKSTTIPVAPTQTPAMKFSPSMHNHFWTKSTTTPAAPSLQVGAVADPLCPVELPTPSETTASPKASVEDLLGPTQQSALPGASPGPSASSLHPRASSATVHNVTPASFNTTGLPESDPTTTTDISYLSDHSEAPLGFSAAVNEIIENLPLSPSASDVCHPAPPSGPSIHGMKAKFLFSPESDSAAPTNTNKSSGSFPPKLKIRFHHYQALKKAVTDYAARQGFSAVDQYKDTISKEEYERLYPGTKFASVPSRGFFYCSRLSANRKKGVDCPLCICYLLKKGENHYSILDRSCFRHSHSCGSRLKNIEGKDYVNFEKDLTKEEQLVIFHLSCAKVTVTQMATALESISPGRAFTPQLLKRLRLKILQSRYGTDMHDLPGLFEKCKQVQAGGGTFEIVPSSSDFGIESIHVQSKLMNEYAAIYRNLKIIDGTHKLSQYNFVFVIHSTICCLLCTHVTGITAHFSENSKAIIEGCHLFYPETKTVTNTVKTGEFTDHYCPFADSEITVPADVKPGNKHYATVLVNTEHPANDDFDLNSSRHSEVDQWKNDISVVDEPDPTLLSDEGPGLKLTAKELGWNQVFGRKHVTSDIMLHCMGHRGQEEIPRRHLQDSQRGNCR